MNRIKSTELMLITLQMAKIKLLKLDKMVKHIIISASFQTLVLSFLCFCRSLTNRTMSRRALLIVRTLVAPMHRLIRTAFARSSNSTMPIRCSTTSTETNLILQPADNRDPIIRLMRPVGLSSPTGSAVFRITKMLQRVCIPIATKHDQLRVTEQRSRFKTPTH